MHANIHKKQQCYLFGIYESSEKWKWCIEHRFRSVQAHRVFIHFLLHAATNTHTHKKRICLKSNWFSAPYGISILFVSECACVCLTLSPNWNEKWYLHVHCCRVYCWSAWLCWKTLAVPANASPMLDYLDECTFVVHFVVRHHQLEPTGFPKTYIGNRWAEPSREQHSNEHPYPSRIKRHATMETCVCNREIKQRKKKLLILCSFFLLNKMLCIDINQFTDMAKNKYELRKKQTVRKRGLEKNIPCKLNKQTIKDATAQKSLNRFFFVCVVN